MPQLRHLAGGLPPALAILLAMAQAAPAQSARFTVTDKVVAPAAEPVTATIDSLGEGSRYFVGGGFEPIYYRNWFTASADAPPDAPGRFAVAPNDISRWDTLRDGALDGADVQVLRIENGRFREVRRGTVAPDGYAVAGWFPVTGKIRVSPDLRGAALGLADWERPGVPRWYAARTFDARGRLSDFSQPARVDLPDSLKPARELTEAERPVPPDLPDDPLAAPDTRGPLPPEGLTARYDDDSGRVMLNWDLPPDDPDIRGVAVYLSYEPPERIRPFGITLTDAATGEGVRRGDMIILRHVIDRPIRGELNSDRIWNAWEGGWLRRLTPGYMGETGDAEWSLERHPPDPLRSWGGLTHLHVELPGRTRFELTQYNHAGTEQDYYEVLEPGVEYRLSVWLRGERPGRAQFRFVGPYGDLPPIALDYGTDWAEATATVTVPEVLVKSEPVGRMELVLQGPGWVDVDDLRFHRADTPFLGITDFNRDLLRDAGISALRTHGLTRAGTSSYDLGAVLRRGGTVLGEHRIAGIPEHLEQMLASDTVPWFQLAPHLAPEEWLGLVEYMAAPFDPATDDPDILPWAALRVAQGQDRPWTDRLERIYLELGNETWNSLFGPWNFPDMTDGATGTSYGRAQVYGLYQAHVAQIMRSSPWWQPSGLEEKARFVIGGWAINDYGTKAAEMAARGDAVDFVTIAAYNGGWDEDEGPPGRNPTSYTWVMNQANQITGLRTSALAEDVRKVARGAGLPSLAFGTYEAGPGYVMDGLNDDKVTPEEHQLQEQVMKGRAAGVATLDTFLMQRQMGMTLQNFFSFKPGGYWASHAKWYRGGRPYPSWSLLGVMNRMGGGEMLEVTARDVPHLDLPAFLRRPAVRRAPQIAVYASREGDRLTVFAISRRVPGSAEGGATACTPVEIALPVSRAQSLRLVRTGGSYDDNPISGPDPVIEEMELDSALIEGGRLVIDASSGAQDCGLPGASAYVYVLEGVAP